MEHPDRIWTPEEYLAFEAASDERHEYWRGRVYAMSGGSRRHAEVIGNVFFSLKSRLRGGPCRPYGSDLKVRVRDAELFTYPDVSVVCGEPLFESERHGTLTNPTLLVEVLSPSTEGYDRGQKFQLYQQLPSLREYVLVSPDVVHVSLYRREGARWMLQPLADLRASVELASIGCTIPLAEWYDGVELPPDPPLRVIREVALGAEP